MLLSIDVFHHLLMCVLCLSHIIHRGGESSIYSLSLSWGSILSTLSVTPKPTHVLYHMEYGKEVPCGINHKLKQQLTMLTSPTAGHN